MAYFTGEELKTIAQGVHPFDQAFRADESGPAMQLITTLAGKHEHLNSLLLAMRKDAFAAIRNITPEGAYTGVIGDVLWEETPEDCDDPRLRTAIKILVQVDAMIEHSLAYGEWHTLDELSEAAEAAATALEEDRQPHDYDLFVAKLLLDGHI